MADCLGSYLQNWPIILQVCEKHRGEIDTNMANKVKNIGIKRNAEDFLIGLKRISVALDRVQSDTCVISETVQIWKDLEKTFEDDDQPIIILKHLMDSYNQAMTDSHFLANLLDPRYRGNDLCVEETDKAMEHILKKLSSSDGQHSISQKQVHSTSTCLCHSKLRNRLGMEKAGKLIFIYKLLNKKSK